MRIKLAFVDQYYCFHFFLSIMQLPLLWQILYILIVGLTQLSSSYETNFTNWSEDDRIEKDFLINTKFIFNRQRYEHVILRTRMNEWSLELSYGNRSNLNKIWTELHLFFDHYHHSTSLNNSIRGHILNQCYPPIISPLTNDSNIYIPELFEMDNRIAKYFIKDGFFRTINYIKCTINERRRNPVIHIEMDIYLVTNREFQSLLYIEMSNETQKLFSDYQARFYLHNHETNFKYNFNISNIDYPLNSNTSVVHMIKLYNQIIRVPSNSVKIFSNIIIILLNFFIFFSFIK